MDYISDRPADGIESVIKDYGNMLFRICLVMLCNEHDAEDALQEVFIKHMSKAPHFNDKEHQKAWLIRVASNICKDMKRFRLRHNYINIDELADYYSSDANADILESVLVLPQKYKLVILLHYVDGYDVESISRITEISVSAVKKRLQRGREMLKLEYGRESSDNESKPVKRYS